MQVVASGLLAPGTEIVPDDVAPTHLDGLPPEIEADWGARVGTDEFIHVECQGYHDPGFLERALWYHLGFALRYRKRRVRTLALWLMPPPEHQRTDKITVGDITVKVTTRILSEVKASDLLANPATACFAPGADAEGRTDDALCFEAATALKARGASWAERHMAVVAATMKGRYGSMVRAMQEVDLEFPIIEDLVRFGEDRGRAEGRRKGLAEGQLQGQLTEARSSLRRTLALRKLALSPEAEQRIDECMDLTTLRRWMDQAVLSATGAEALR